MQKFFTTVLLILSLNSYGQKGKFNPFKLIVIQPDTANIFPSLYRDIDSIQIDYQKRFYNSLKQEEDFLNSKDDDYPKDMQKQPKADKEKARQELPLLKAKEAQIKNFKYFQTLSSYSAEVYNFYFNEYEPFSTIIELPNQNTDIASLNKLADTSKTDYIVFFNNVHTEIKDGQPILRLTTSLYSKKDNKIILTKETEGDATSRGDMWTCGSTYLSCLLINGVRTSTDAVAPEIAKHQIRH